MPAAPAQRSLVVLITVAEEAAERCNAGFTVAAAAASAGASVSLWLTGDAVWLATARGAGAVDLPHAAPLDGLLDLLLGAGSVSVTELAARRRGLTESDLIAGVRIAGASSYVEEILAPDTQALVF